MRLKHKYRIHNNIFIIAFLYFLLFLYIVKGFDTPLLFAQQKLSSEIESESSRILDEKERRKREIVRKLERIEKEKVDLIYKKGKEAFKNADYENARLRFKEVLQRDSTHSGAKRYLSSIDAKIEEKREKEKQEQERIRRQHEIEQAKKEAEKVQSIYREGREDYKKADYQRAKTKFEEALMLDPTHREVKRYLELTKSRIEGIRKDKRDDVEEREKQRVIEKTSKKIEKIQSIYKEGKGSYKKANYREARLKFEEALKLDPTHKGAKKYLQLAKSEIKEREIPIRTQPGPGKLTIEDCINVAIENYYPLEIADKQIELARQKVREATRKLFPSLSLKWEEIEGADYTGRDYEGRKYKMEGQQPLFRGGELWFTLQQSKVNLTIAEENKKRLKSELILSVRKAFYSLIKAKETLKQQEHLLGKAEEIFNSINKQYGQGLCSELEFLDVQSKYNQLYFQFISADEDLKLAELILKQAINTDPEQSIDIEYSLEFIPLEIDLESCINLAFKNRAEIRINELVTEFTKYGKKIALAKGYPKVDLSGSYGKGGEAYKEQSLDVGDEWHISAKVSVPFGGSTGEYSFTKQETAPVYSIYQGTETVLNTYKINIFDDLRYFSAKKEANIEYEQAREQLNKIKKEVIMKVKEAFFGYEKSLIQIDAAKSKVKFQSKEAEIFKMRMDLGEIKSSQVIEALIKLAQEQFAYVQAITGYYTAIANINSVIGVDDYFKL